MFHVIVEREDMVNTSCYKHWRKRTHTNTSYQTGQEYILLLYLMYQSVLSVPLQRGQKIPRGRGRGLSR